jgi:putative ATP-dependent endonuclease of OLD family
MDRIISAAIKKKSKPLLALLLVEAIERNGLRGVPLAFATLLEETRKLGNSPFL